MTGLILAGWAASAAIATATLVHIYRGGTTANDHAADYSSWFLWPAFSFQVYPGNLLNTYMWRPVSVDTTMVYRGWYEVDGVETDVVARLARALSIKVRDLRAGLALALSIKQGWGPGWPRALSIKVRDPC